MPLTTRIEPQQLVNEILSRFFLKEKYSVWSANNGVSTRSRSSWPAGIARYRVTR